MCRFCFDPLYDNESFLYCYLCTLTYCNDCYEKFKNNNMKIIGNSKDPVTEICTLDEIDSLTGNTLVVYHLK
jgi:alkyl hydroperoxide reductase subunit AhpC